ncbi:MAG: hypothetical protein RLZZ356_721, partial [Verrucomicrobiota bacterium]
EAALRVSPGNASARTYLERARAMLAAGSRPSSDARR